MSGAIPAGSAAPALPRRGAGLALVFAALAVLLVLPMLLVQVPLGADLVPHLARIYVRAHLDSDPDLARLFRIKSEAVPYLGMDLLLTPLARVLPVLLVGRIFVAALACGLVAAVATVQRVITGRVGLSAAAAGLIAYNGLLAWGLLNYTLGVILSLLAFAAWHGLRAKPWPWRLALFAAIATLIYFTHVLAFVLYGVLVGSYELFGLPHVWRRRWSDWLVLAGQAVPALLLWHRLHETMLVQGASFSYDGVAKLYALMGPLLFGGAAGGRMDPGLVLFGAGFLAAGAALILNLRHRWLSWPRVLAAPILTLLALTLLLPFRVDGVGLNDYRLMVPALCLAFAGLRLTRPPPLRAVLLVGAAVALGIALRVADVVAATQRCDRQYAELADALDALPRGAEMATVLERSDPAPAQVCTTLPVYDHIGSLVTIRRSGLSPDFYVNVTGVAVRGARTTDTSPMDADNFTTAPTQGYLLWLHLGHPRPVPPGLALVRRGTFFDLFAAAPAAR